eukprot:jgi/Mesvir1/22201/Mv18797-RA.1
MSGRGSPAKSRLLLYVTMVAGVTLGILGALYTSSSHPGHPAMHPFDHGPSFAAASAVQPDSTSGSGALVSSLRSALAQLQGEYKDLLRAHEVLSQKIIRADHEREIAQAKEREAAHALETFKRPEARQVALDVHVAVDPSMGLQRLVPDRRANPALADILDKVAKNREVLVAISNFALVQQGMLQTWLANVRLAGVTNFMVVALDDEIADFLKKEGVAYYRKYVEVPASQKDVGSNHAISGLKFSILREFLLLGVNVLLSDVDIVTLQDPFQHLVRDADVESMTDGWDNRTAYGYNDVFDDAAMGWARYAHSMRVFVFNSGLFYMQATVPSLAVLDAVAARLAAEKAWDQAVFNEVIFFPSRPGYTSPPVRRRVMDYMLFMNSKTLFKYVRGVRKYHDHRPVMIHVNYHPDKHERMKAIVKYYREGDVHALDRFPVGSEH